MKQARLIVLCLLLLLCLLAPARPRTEHTQPTNLFTAKPSPLSYTLETKEAQFFEPFKVQVVLRNNSRSTISLDTRNLRLKWESWYVVGTNGSWSGDGRPLETEAQPSGRVELSPATTLRLFAVVDYLDFELLGPVRLTYKLQSTDAGIQKLLPNGLTELRFDILPTKSLTAVWAAQTQTERESTQPAFNDFLRFRGAVLKEEQDGKSGRDMWQDEEHVTKTLYYMAGYALPFLSDAAKSRDPFIRAQAVLAYPFAAGSIDQFDAYLDALDTLGPRPQWALNLKKNHNRDQANWREFASRALTDAAPEVRVAAVSVLTQKYWSEPKFHSTYIGYPKNDSGDQSAVRTEVSRERNAVQALASDPDPGVRAAVQKYLLKFADDKDGIGEAVIDALSDPDSTVRQNAIDSLLRSPQPPSVADLKRGFNLAKGETAVALMPLFLELEDATLSTTLANEFTRRSEPERLAIMTAIAGHTDSATLDLIKSGLSDSSPAIQRAALMRLLPFPRETSAPLIDNYSSRASSELRAVAQAVKAESETRKLWPFLGGVSNTQAAASESAFPSQNGTMPITSPDGQRIAYNETGWGRPGGSGGFGRSNLISIAHVVDTNGSNDHVVSDMFLVEWMSDSKRIGTARDGFVSISDLTGNVVAEFGVPFKGGYYSSATNRDDWTKSDLRSQFGGFMPHQKRLERAEDFGFGEGGAFSPDGKLYGPISNSKGAFFLRLDGQRLPLNQPLGNRRFGDDTWSPDGRFVLVPVDSVWLIIDMQTMNSHYIQNLDDSYLAGACGYNQCRWNPWSKDGKQLTFLRDGQVWVSDPYGNSARQLTFDSARKAFPAFSRDGRLVAYRTWQPDNRRRNVRLGPSDIWIVDVASTLATRVTGPAKAKVHNFDWLDDHTLILDRIDENDDSSFFIVPKSSLRRISLTTPSSNK